MSINKSSVYFSVALILAVGPAFAKGWESAQVETSGISNNSADPALLRQKNQLISKQKQYQKLIQQVNQSLVKRPDLKTKLLSELKNYTTKKQGVDAQLAQVNQRLRGVKVSADDDAVIALAAQFNIGGKASVFLPDLLKAKTKKEKQAVKKRKLTNSGYGLSTRDPSVVIDKHMLFENGSAKLLPTARQRVANLAGLYHRFGGEFSQIVIKGHTNSVGNYNDNLILSRARSNTVKSRLMELRVPASVIVTQGYGESQLLPSTDPASPMNRRVEYGLITR